jgi:hypothetical protein
MEPLVKESLPQATEVSAPRRLRRQFAVGLLISLITIIICLGGIELAGYIWEKNTAQGPLGWTLVASRRLHLERHGSNQQPYYLFGPNEDYLWGGIPVHIDSRGFRTQEFTVPKPANTFRILNIGDSVVFGWEVHQDETYGKQLEQLLNKTDPSKHYEVINAGIPGWNPEDERNFLLGEGLQYQPDLVILDLTIVNDIYGKTLTSTMSGGWSLFSWLRDHTYGWPFLTTEFRFLLSRKQGPEAIPVLNPPKEASAYFPLDENSPVWDHVWSFIAEMNQVCKNQNIDFVVVAFPTAFQLNSENHPDTPQKVFSKLADKAEIPFIDLLPIYRQVCESASPGACEGYKNLLFADVWMHPNPYGHSLAAKAIYKWMTNSTISK